MVTTDVDQFFTIILTSASSALTPVRDADVVMGIVTCGHWLFVSLFAVVAVAMLCGYAESNGKGCYIIGVLGIILGVFGSFLSAMDLHKYSRGNLASLVRTGLIVKLVTDSTYILPHAFLCRGAG